jgi:hypothetical protein
MTERKAVPAAPGPLEGYAAQFDNLWAKVAHRESFRAYLQGLLLPRDRNKTLTGLVGARPIEEAQHSRVQKLQYFLSESPWDSVRPSTPAAWICSWMTPARLLTRKESSSSMIAGTANPVTRPTMWPASTWVPSARSIMALWRSVACGPTTAFTSLSMLYPTLPLDDCLVAGKPRISEPSPNWAWSW